jgi:hypothetical protein
MGGWGWGGREAPGNRRLRRLAPRAALAGSLACAAWLSQSHAWAAQGAGTVADPVRVDLLPYALAASTEGSPSSVIDFYEPCAPTTDETGPELVFVFTLPEEARVTAWLEGDGGGVDVDVQLLDDLSLEGSVATGCLARGNVIAEALMSAGTHFVVVDSYAGAAQAGEFVLHLDAVGPSWSERTVAQGVTWRARRHVDPQLGAQLEHLLVIDPTVPGVSVEARQSSGCQTIGQMGAALGAVAGVNGGYFDVSTCAPVSLLKHDGALLASNGATRGAFGLSPQNEPLSRWWRRAPTGPPRARRTAAARCWASPAPPTRATRSGPPRASRARASSASTRARSLARARPGTWCSARSTGDGPPPRA